MILLMSSYMLDDLILPYIGGNRETLLMNCTFAHLVQYNTVFCVIQSSKKKKFFQEEEFQEEEICSQYCNQPNSLSDDLEAWINPRYK